MRFSAAIALLSVLGVSPSPVPSPVTNTVRHTQAAVQLYVSTTGNDSKLCTGTGLNACRTIQGAIDKVPKYIKHAVDISVAAGVYDAGFVVSGFTLDDSLPTASFTIHSSLAASTTLAAGTATGTATSGTEGVGTTFGTLVDSTQNWTVNDLKNRILIRVGGTGALGTDFVWIISSNTATQITTTGNQTPIDVTSTYMIADPVARVTGDVAVGAITSHAAVAVFSQNQSRTVTPFAVEDLTLAANSTQGISVAYINSSSVSFTNVQIRSPVGQASSVYLSGSGSNFSMTSSSIDCNLGGALHGRGIIGSVAVAELSSIVSLQYSRLEKCSEAIWEVGNLGLFYASEISQSDRPIQLLPFALVPSGAIVGSRIDGSVNCAWAAVDTSLRGSSFGGESQSVVYVDSLNVTSCSYGVRAYGGAVNIAALSGSATVAGVVASAGGRMYVTRTGYTMSAPLEAEVDDDAALSSTLLALGPGDGGTGCLASLSSGSRVCTR